MIGTSGTGPPAGAATLPGPRRSLSTTSARPRPLLRDPGSARLQRVLPLALGVAALLCLATPGLAQEAKEPAYRAFPYVGSRLAIWVIAQIHLNFAAFILGVPIF